MTGGCVSKFTAENLIERKIINVNIKENRSNIKYNNDTIIIENHMVVKEDIMKCLDKSKTGIDICDIDEIIY